MIKKNLIGLAGVLLMVSGCGGTGQQYPSGTVCPTEYNPIPVNIDSKVFPHVTKLSLKLEDNQILAGTYNYISASIYYHNKKTGVKMHYAHLKNEKKKDFEPKIVCLAGFKPGMEPLTVLAGGVSKMVVDVANKPILFDVHEYLINFGKTGFTPVFAKAKDANFSAPEKVYEGPGEEFAFYKMNKQYVNFEIRSKVNIDPDSSVSLQIVLKRDDTQLRF